MQEEKVNGYYQNQRSEIMEFVQGRPRRILEIGCAEGRFRSNLTWENEYWGIEYVPEVAQKAKDKLDHVLAGDFMQEARNLPDHYFDLVICNDVIEHIDNTALFLERVSQKISRGKSCGQLVGSVPNVRCMTLLYQLVFKGDWHYVPWGILDETHLRFFTLKSLHRTLVENGWDVEKIKAINPVGRTRKQRRLFALIRPFLKILLGPTAPYWQIGFSARFTHDDQC